MLTKPRGRANLEVVKTELGKYLRQQRLSKHLTLEALAALSGVGWTTIQAIEIGDSLHPRRETLEALATALGEDVSILVLKAYALPRTHSPADPVEVSG